MERDREGCVKHAMWTIVCTLDLIVYVYNAPAWQPWSPRLPCSISIAGVEWMFPMKQHVTGSDPNPPCAPLFFVSPGMACNVCIIYLYIYIYAYVYMCASPSLRPFCSSLLNHPAMTFLPFGCCSPRLSLTFSSTDSSIRMSYASSHTRPCP